MLERVSAVSWRTTSAAPADPTATTNRITVLMKSAVPWRPSRRARRVRRSAAGVALTRASSGRVPEARHHVVVSEARGLHERVDGRRPDEAEAAPLEVPAERDRLRRRRRELTQLLPRADDRGAVDE